MTIRYNSDDGDPYEDRFPLDTDLIAMTTSSESSKSPHNLAKEGEKHLRKMGAALDSLAKVGRKMSEPTGPPGTRGPAARA